METGDRMSSGCVLDSGGAKTDGSDCKREKERDQMNKIIIAHATMPFLIEAYYSMC